MAEHIVVKSAKTGRTVEFDYEAGANYEEAVALFGAEAIFHGFIRATTIAVQNSARVVLDKRNEAGGPANTPEVAVAAGMGYKPGSARRAPGAPKKDPVQALAEQLAGGKVTLADLQKMLTAKVEELKAQQAKAPTVEPPKTPNPAPGKK